MFKSNATCALAGALVVCATLLTAQVASSPAPVVNSRSLPLLFEPNAGQHDRGIRFAARTTSGISLFLSDTTATIAVGSRRAASAGAARNHAATQTNAAIRMQLIGAQAPQASRGLDQQAAVVHYLRGPKSAWRTNVATYAKAEFAGVYPGIDLVYHGTTGQLEYDFIVSPGADPGVIRVGFEGAKSVVVNAGGTLSVKTAAGTLELGAPVLYQEIDGRRVRVDGAYRAFGGSQIGFQVGPYEKSAPLVIDPTLAYGSIVGGGLLDWQPKVAVDTKGDAYVVGYTNSTDLPTVNPFEGYQGGQSDLFVAKLNPTGTGIQYLTYLGGNDYEYPAGIAVDAAGQAYVCGLTRSPDFPIVNSPQSVLGTSFVSKLNAAGSDLVYSQTFGGSVKAIAVAAATGDAYVTGDDTPFGSTDAFVIRFAPGGASVWKTWLGGTGTDTGNAIAVSPSGAAVYVAGKSSYSFPTTAGVLQTGYCCNHAFVAKLSSDGAIQYSTQLGGSGTDEITGIAVDAAGAAYVTGTTDSTDFPTTEGAFRRTPAGGTDLFAAKLNPSGTALVYSTLLGGRKSDRNPRIGVDDSGNAVIGADAYSADLPVDNAITAAPQPPFGVLGKTRPDLGLDISDSGISASNAYDVSYNPADRQDVLAATLDGVYRSSNGGVSWTKIPGVDAITLGRAPSSPAVVYAASADQCVLRASANGGATWNAGIAVSGCWLWRSQIAVHPNDPRSFLLTTGKGLFKSMDGGASITRIGTATWQANSAAWLPGTTNGAIVATSNAGVWETLDGTAWSNVLNQTIGAILIDPTDSSILAFGDHKLYRSRDVGGTWVSSATLADVYASNLAAIAPSDHRVLYVADMGTERGPLITKSADGGATWATSTIPSIATGLAVSPFSADAALIAMAVYESSWVGKLNATGTRFVYGTYLAGTYGNRFGDLAVDGLGSAYVTGDVAKSFPVTPGPLASQPGNSNVYVAKIIDATPTCTYSVTPNHALLASWSVLELAVVSPAGCAWTASAADSWLEIISGASGMGAGIVRVAVGTTTTNPTGTLNVAGQTITIDVAVAGSLTPFRTSARSRQRG